MSISALIMAQNEEWHLARSLASVAWADEVVLVDGGSTDQTKQIARRAGATVHSRLFDDFGRQRSFALSKTKTDWVFGIDADEEATPELRKAIEAAIGFEEPSPCNGYAIERRNFFFGKPLRHLWANDWQMRLFRRASARVTHAAVHEGYVVSGPTGRITEGLLNHYTCRSLSQYVQKMDQYTSLGAPSLLARKERIRGIDFVAHPLSQLWKDAVAHRGMLDGITGVTACLLSAITSLVEYVKAFELQCRQKSPRASACRDQ